MSVLFIAASAAVSFAAAAVLQKIMIPRERIKSLTGGGDAVFLFGGVPFILAVETVSTLLLGVNSLSGNYIGIEQSDNTKLWAGIFAALCFAAAGFADDNAKIVKNSVSGIKNLNMTAIQILIVVSYLFALFFAFGKAPYMFIPFTGNVYSGLLFWIAGLVICMGSVNSYRLFKNKDRLYLYINIMSLAAVCVMSFIKKKAGCGIVSAAAAGGLISFCVYGAKMPALASGTAGMIFMGGIMLACVYSLDCPFMLLLLYAVFIIEGLYYLVSSAVSGKNVTLYMKMQKSGADDKLICLIYLAADLIFCTAGIIMMIL